MNGPRGFLRYLRVLARSLEDVERLVILIGLKLLHIVAALLLFYYLLVDKVMG